MSGTTRLSTVPLDHVVAELAAFPLASEEAFRLNVLELQPGLEAPTAALWRHAETKVFGALPGFSLDEAVALRDRVWFRRGCVSMHKYVRDIARLFLVARGDLAIPRLPGDEFPLGRADNAREPRARQAWRWLSFAIPPDLLLSGLYNTSGGPQRIALLSPMLSMQLRETGFCETHLHYGAALDFPTLWVATLRAIGEGYTTAFAFRSPGADFRDGELLAPWLIRAATIRYLLAAWLSWGRVQHSFAEFLDSRVPELVLRDIGAANYLRILTAIVELQRGCLYDTDDQNLEFADWQHTYRLMTETFQRSFPKTLDDIPNADPIARLFPDRAGGGPTPESRFQIAALDFLDSDEDKLFCCLFWQVMRVRCLLYRHIVQRPLTPGLQWFIRFYARSSPVKKPLTHGVMIQSAAKTCGIGRGLRSLEARTSPESSQSEMLALIKKVDDTARHIRRKHKGFEFGIVLHFTKDRGGGARQGIPTANLSGSNADPDFPPNGGYRYAFYYQKQVQKAASLASVLRRFPLAIQTVRGVDVCADELGVPTWVLVPLINSIRAAADQGCTFLQFGGIHVPPLRTTTHSGEDFVHLLTGLRYVDEALERFHLREGDRIGHGLALGIDPLLWAFQTIRLVMTQEQRLFDLVWQWKLSGTISDGNTTQNVQPLVQQISCLSESIFGSELTPYQLCALSEDLHNINTLRSVGFPWGFYPADPRQLVYQAALRRRASDLSRLELLHVYLCSSDVFRAGQRTIWIDLESEAAILASLQAHVREKLGARGVAVEVNPTSNLLVGDLGDLHHHPLWRLNSPMAKGDVPPVAVCIGSDDPIVFTSRLREEYQLLADSMAMSGLSDEQARGWLDRAAACGLTYRFTLDRYYDYPIRDPAFVNTQPYHSPVDALT